MTSGKLTAFGLLFFACSPAKPEPSQPNLTPSSGCVRLEARADGEMRVACVTPEQIAVMIPFIVKARGGASPPAPCTNLPGSTFCATDLETVRGIDEISRLREEQNKR